MEGADIPQCSFTFLQIKPIPPPLSLSLFISPPLQPFQIDSLLHFSLCLLHHSVKLLFFIFALSLKFPYSVKLWHRTFPFSPKQKIRPCPQSSLLSAHKQSIVQTAAIVFERRVLLWSTYNCIKVFLFLQ